MRCQEVRPMLYTYLDGSLAGQVERAFFGHLSQCKSCQQELDYARQTHALLEKYCTPVEPPSDFMAQVMSALDGTTDRKQVAKIQVERKVASTMMKKSPQGVARLSWNLRRIAQVASFVLLSATVWFATQFGIGFQLARTPEPGNIPETGYQVVKEPEEQTPAQDFAAGVRPDIRETQDPVSAGETNSEPVTSAETPEKDSKAPSEVKGDAGDNTGAEQQPPLKDPMIDTPGVTQEGVPSISDPIPTPVIVEPGGPLKAAGFSREEALHSVSLHQVAGGETKRSNGIFTDGQFRYLVGNTGEPLEIWVAGNEGQNPELLGKTAKTVNGKAIWSPDGKKLAYLHQENNHLALYRDDLSGGAVQVASTQVEQGDIKFPVWSKKGEIAYLFSGATGNQIVVSRDQGSSLVIGSADVDCGPAWSPDGTSLAYGKNGQIYMASRDGNQVKAIIELGGKIQGISWSPDGSSLAVSIKDANSQQGLWVGSIDNIDWRKLTEVGGGREISWSPDGQKLAFTDVQGAAYLLTFDQEGKRDKLYLITDAGNSGVAALAWSPDSQALIMEWEPTGEVRGIWRADLP